MGDLAGIPKHAMHLLSDTKNVRDEIANHSVEEKGDIQGVPSDSTTFVMVSKF